MTTKAEREEIWQIIQYLTNLGLNVVKTETQGTSLMVSLAIPLLHANSTSK